MIKRTYRGRLSSRLFKQLADCVNTFNSCKMGRSPRKTQLLAKFSFTRKYFGSERVDTITLEWERRPFPRTEWYKCRTEDHGLLIKKVIESLPRHLRNVPQE